MNIALTKQWIEHWEGRRSKVYLDSKGIPTIGVGCNLQDPSNMAAIFHLGLSAANLISGAVSLTDDQIDYLLTDAVYSAISGCRAMFPLAFDSFPDNVQLVLTDMMFNLGYSRFSGFKLMIACVKDRDWKGASDQMVQSAWYHQVGTRAMEDAAVMAGLTTPEAVLGVGQ